MVSFRAFAGSTHYQLIVTFACIRWKLSRGANYPHRSSHRPTKIFFFSTVRHRCWRHLPRSVREGVRALRQEHVVPIAGTLKNVKEHLLSYERFVRSPAKSFFKELFLRDTRLARNFKKMTEWSGILKGLKNQECKRGANAQRPPIAYVPVIDEVHDALNANLKEPHTKKIKLVT